MMPLRILATSAAKGAADEAACRGVAGVSTTAESASRECVQRASAVADLWGSALIWKDQGRTMRENDERER
jgi:hypothetical protein